MGTSGSKSKHKHAPNRKKREVTVHDIASEEIIQCHASTSVNITRVGTDNEAAFMQGSIATVETGNRAAIISDDINTEEAHAADETTLICPEVDPDAKLLCEDQEVFLEPHIDRCPSELSYCKSIKIKKIQYCCWRSEKDTQIFLGGEKTITVLKEDGNLNVCQLWDDNMYVISGLAVTNEKQLICAASMYEDVNNTLWTVNIPKHLPVDSQQHHVNRLIAEEPVCVFVVDKLRYGVLCTTKQIEFYSLKNILLDREPSAIDILKLDIEICNEDTACATADGNIVVTSMDTQSFYIYNYVGDMIKEFNQDNKWSVGNDWNKVFWDGEHHRLFVQCCETGVVLTSDNGVVCTLREDRWVILKTQKEVERLGNVGHCVYSGGRMWFVNGENLDEVHVYKCSDSQTDMNVGANDTVSAAIIEPTISCCPKSLEYNKSITTKGKYICCWRSAADDQIFLGGENRISMLKEEGSDQMFKLWDDKLQVICGLTLTSKDQMILLKDKEGNTYLYTVNIPSDFNNGTKLNPTNYIQISSPICIFAASKIHYGVLCASKQIEVFTLKSILLDTNPVATNVIKLDFDVSLEDMACVTYDGRVCVTSLRTPALCIYKVNGEMMNLYSLECQIYSWLQRHLDGHKRLFVQACGDAFVLVSDNGIVCTLSGGKCENMQVLTKVRVDNISVILNTVSSEDRMWFIERQFDRDCDIIHIYKSTSKVILPTAADPELPRYELGGYKMPVIKDGAKHIRSHTLPRKYVRIWNTADPGVMAMGGYDEYVIALINQDGDILRENMLYVPDVKKLQSGLNLYDKKLGVSYADRINSGLYLVQNMHAVITLKLNDTFSHKLLVVNIDPTYTTSIIKNMDIIRPVRVFDISTTQFGVLSWGKQPTNHIHVYNKQDQSHVSTTDVVYKAATTDDSVAVLPGGGWAVASRKNDRVYMFDESGTLIETVGARAEHELMNKPGLLYHPFVIKVDTEGGILVTCVYGDTHRYHQHTWDLVAVFKGDQHGLWDYCYNGHNIFTVHKNKLKVFHAD